MPTYQFPEKTRKRPYESLGTSVDGLCSAGTVTFNADIPPFAYITAWTFKVAGTDAVVTVTVTPWVDHDQTLLADSNYKFLKVGATTATTNVSLAATGTSLGSVGVVVPTGDQYGAAAPIVTPHGSQVTISTTSSTGTWEITYLNVEI